MTREEAIRQLDGADVAALNRDFFKFNQAIIMAISALRQQEPVTKCHDLFDEDGGEILPKSSGMTLDDAIAHLDDTLSDMERKWSCESCRMEHAQLRLWLIELRDIKRKRNEPLTMDELREAAETGDPVWIVGSKSNNTQLVNGWVVIERVLDDALHQYVDYAEFGSDEPFYFKISDYGDLLKAYRRRPKEADHA